MGVTSHMAERRARTVNPMHPRDPGLKMLFGLGERTRAGEDVDAQRAMTQAAWYRGVVYLQTTIASLPLQVYQRSEQGRSLARNVPYYALLHDRPNRYQTSFEWREMMLDHLIHRGKFLAEKVMTGDRHGIRPYELIPRHPDRITPFWAPDGSRAFNYRPPSGPERIILADEAMYVLLRSKDGLNGQSILESARETIGLALAQEGYAATAFEDGEYPSGVIKMQKSLSDEALERFIKRWRERRREGRQQWALLEEGMETQELGLTPEDAELIDAQKFSLLQIARFLGVLPTKMFTAESVSYNGMEHENLAATTDSIRPWCVRIEQVLLRDLFAADGEAEHFAEFNLDGLMRGDYKTRQEGRAIQRQWGAISADEWRASENMNPQPDGQGEVYLVPLNMISAKTAAADTGITGAKKEADVPASPAGETVQELALNGAQIASLLTIIQQVTAKQISSATAKQLIRVAFPSLPDATIAQLVDSADEFEPVLSEAARDARSRTEQRSRVGVAMTRLRTAYAPTIQDAVSRVLKREEIEVTKRFKQMAGARSLADFTDWLPVFYAAHREIVARQMLPVMSSYALAVRDLMAPFAGGDPEEIDLTAFVAAYVESYASRHVGLSQSRIAATIESNGDGLMEALTTLLASWPAERAASVAANEVVQEGTAIARETWRSSGVTKLVWVASGDGCPLCRAIDGQVVGIEREFVFDGEEVDGGDRTPLVARKTLHPPLHGGCGCSIAPA